MAKPYLTTTVDAVAHPPKATGTLGEYKWDIKTKITLDANTTSVADNIYLRVVRSEKDPLHPLFKPIKDVKLDIKIKEATYTTEVVNIVPVPPPSPLVPIVDESFTMALLMEKIVTVDTITHKYYALIFSEEMYLNSDLTKVNKPKAPDKWNVWPFSKDATVEPPLGANNMEEGYIVFSPILKVPSVNKIISPAQKILYNADFVDLFEGFWDPTYFSGPTVKFMQPTLYLLNPDDIFGLEIGYEEIHKAWYDIIVNGERDPLDIFGGIICPGDMTPVDGTDVYVTDQGPDL